jgi:hypothetical protein
MEKVDYQVNINPFLVESIFNGGNLGKSGPPGEPGKDGTTGLYRLVYD